MLTGDAGYKVSEMAEALKFELLKLLEFQFSNETALLELEEEVNSDKLEEPYGYLRDKERQLKEKKTLNM